MNQNCNPKISIIIPILNTEKYLEACLNSVLDQTLKDIEIICVDNGSSDGSCRIVEKYQERYHNLLLYKHPIGRQGAARNVGFDHAKGEYIGFVDSDDYVRPNMFEKMYALAKAHSADVVVCNMNLFFQHDNSIRQQLPDHWFENNGTLDVIKSPQFFRNLTICNKIFKRQFLVQNKIRFPEEQFHEDQLFVVKSFILGRNIVTVREPLYFYRKQREKSVSSFSDASVFDIFPAVEKIRSFIKDDNLQSRYGSLVEEIMISRYLMFFFQVEKKLKRKYFTFMKKSFQCTVIQKPLRILTLTEYRNFCLIKNYPYMICLAILIVKNFLTILLQIQMIRMIYISLQNAIIKR